MEAVRAGLRAWHKTKVTQRFDASDSFRRILTGPEPKAEPFIFGIPLIARDSCQDWARVNALLGLTLASVAAQTERDFQIVIAGHNHPNIDFAAAPVSFFEADWPAEDVRADNRDSGRKKHAICEHVLAAGGGLLMFLDADDWVDRRTVAAARDAIGPDRVGGYIGHGVATDVQRERIAPLPHPSIFQGDFHRLCGSSTVARLIPDHPDPLWRNPHAVLHEHYRWIEDAAERGVAIAPLPVTGNYVVNTAANHSETFGPFADWRRTFCDAVMREGEDLDDARLAPFGLTLNQVRAALA